MLAASLSRRPWLLVSAAWTAPAILSAINELAQPRLLAGDQPSLAQVLFASGDWFVYAFLTPGVFALSRRWPVARPHVAERAALHLVLSLAFCVAWAAMGVVLRSVLAPDSLWGGTMTRHFISWVFITLPFGVPVYLAMVGVEHAIRYFVEARDRELQMARLSEQVSTARFEALQARVNPHFLFNTLNTIAVLVRDDDKRGATRIVEQLADVLRITLSRHQAPEVSLGDELELVRQYLAIEQARFPDRLRPLIDVDERLLSAAVPSFAVQQLVENAVRHGIARQPDAGRLTLAARRERQMLEIVVSNDGPPFDAAAASSRRGGISNTRDRIRELHGELASLSIEPGAGGGAIATLRLPFREIVLEPGDGRR
jgi:two-component system, LytTR family, sensor kinase